MIQLINMIIKYGTFENNYIKGIISLQLIVGSIYSIGKQ